MRRIFSLAALALFFGLAGLNHFWNPQPYLAMMPPYLPFHEALNFISGTAEIAGALGLLIPALRRAAAWGLMALLIAVFPANIHVAIHGWNGVSLPVWVLWARLPLQFLLLAWVHDSGLSKPKQRVIQPSVDRRQQGAEGIALKKRKSLRMGCSPH